MHANSESTENIDEIVQDHDNFGTDENEDDSSLGMISNHEQLSHVQTSKQRAENFKIYNQKFMTFSGTFPDKNEIAYFYQNSTIH